MLNPLAAHTQHKTQALVGADDLLNYSQLTDTEHLPDSSLDNHNHRYPSDTEGTTDPTLGPLGLFSFFDHVLMTPVDSSPVTSKRQQVSQSQSQRVVGSQGIGDGNSLRNQMALQSLRDISIYEVKKVKFAEEDK